MKRAISIVSIVVLLISLAGFAYGQMGRYGEYGNRYKYGRGRGHGMMRGSGMGYGVQDCPMIEQYLFGSDYYLEYHRGLQLSEKQIESLRDLRSESLKSEAEKRAELDALFIDLDSELSRDKIDLKKARSINKRISELQADVRFGNIEEAIEARKLLNEDQINRIELDEDYQYRGRGGYCR